MSHDDFDNSIVKDHEYIGKPLKFIPIEEQNCKSLTNTALTSLKNIDLIEDCRGQSYVNAANMLRKYLGLEERIKEKCKFTTFVPYEAPSFNLGSDWVCTRNKKFSQMVQKLYT